MNKKVFLDTSIMIDRLWKDKKTKEKSDKILNNYDTSISSNYVRMEFKRGVLQYYVYLYNKIAVCNSLSEVEQSIMRLSVTPQVNRFRTLLEFMTNFFDEIYKKRPSEIIRESGDISIDEYRKEMIKSSLRRLIRNSWRRFDKIVDTFINSQRCFTDIQPPREKGELFDNRPGRCHDECDIRKFFNETHEDFSKILQKLCALESPDKEIGNMMKTMKEILRVKKRSIDPKECWKCGDAIIAVEAPKDADVFNNNQRHYNPICEAIGKVSIGYEV